MDAKFSSFMRIQGLLEVGEDAFESLKIRVSD
jgi:hypothetical protein